MSTYMHHEQYDPEEGAPTRQNLIELIDKYSNRPFIPVFHLDRDGTFTNLSAYARRNGTVVVEDDGNPMLRYRYYVGCRECYQMLKARITDQPFGHLFHEHMYGSNQ